MSAKTSIAAASRAPGVIERSSSSNELSVSWQAEHNTDHEDNPHDEQSQATYAVQDTPVWYVVARHMHRGVRDPRQHENPGKHQKYIIGVLRDDFQNREYIEQHRQFELVAECICACKRRGRPGRLAERDLLPTNLLPAQRGG